MEDGTMTEDGQGTKALTECKLGFARKLASPSKKTRDKAISLLLSWMTSQKKVKEEELKKIWKGLFYCVWHSDKLSVQEDLIERLASLTEKLDTALALQFFKVFLSTMRREWGGIDRLRLDKFYLLLRKYLSHMFVALENSGWDTNITTAFMDALLERTFLAEDHYAALGINLHYAEIFLEELEKFLPLRAETFRNLLEPFLVVSANTSDKSFLKRLRESIFGRLLDLSRTVLKSKEEGNDLDGNVELLGSMALSLPISSEAFKLASMPSTAQSNRKMLYELHEEFGKVENLLKLLGITLNLADIKKSKKHLEQSRSMALARKGKIKQKYMVKDSKQERCSVGSNVISVGGHVKARESSNDTGSVTGINSPEIFDRGILAEKKIAKKKGKGSNEKVSNHNSQVQEQETLAGSEVKKKKSKQKSLENEAHVVDKVHQKDSFNKRKGKSGRKQTNDCAADSELGLVNDGDSLIITDPVVSNLKQQFDLLAAEGSNGSGTCSTPIPLISAGSFLHNTSSKKRKRASDITVNASRDVQENGISSGSLLVNGVDSNGKSSGKAKRVRFALKKNLVWKPYSPLPPQNLRVPPSATPRGSALKKGVPPGPVVLQGEISSQERKRKPRMPLTPFVRAMLES